MYVATCARSTRSLRPARKLKFEVTRIFNEHGGDFNDVKSIREDDVLYASAGEKFITAKANANKLPNEWVRLNVGGQVFCTARSTILSDPDTMLAKLFGGYIPSAVDSTGAVLFDRDPEYFTPLLNYLRTGVLTMPESLNPSGVLEEARFFNFYKLEPYLETLVRRERKSLLTRDDIVRTLINSPSNTSLRCQGLDLEGINLSKLDLSHINFRKCVMIGADLSNATMTGTQLADTNLTSANLSGCMLRGANLAGARLDDVVMRHAILDDNGGTHTSLESASLMRAVLEDCDFSGANLRAANLRDANLQNSSLHRANLAGANFEGANLKGANLSKANLIGSNLRAAHFDSRTVI
jgi:uncharacterized protein YjbI with pentapeptide repeats